MDEAVRTFIALEIPFKVKENIERMQDLIKKKNFFYGKFTELENLHLTIKFLGELNEGKIKEVIERLKKIKIKEFEARVGEIGVFSENSIRILWVKINGKGIFELQSQIDEVLSDIFKKEERFMSHLTIARIKKVCSKKEFLDYIHNLKNEKISFEIKEFVLKKSELRPEGPVYGI